MARKTDREVSEELHQQLSLQVDALRGLGVHAPMPYIEELIRQASALLQAANTAWREEEQRAGVPLWR